MTNKTFTLEFITPCFCAGADQSHAELRSSAIRGQLRWWFRAIGGSAQEEAAIFGGVAQSSPNASSIQVRTIAIPEGGEARWWANIERNGTGNSAYLLGFFCGSTRLQQKGALAPKSRAKVFLRCRSLPNRSLDEKLAQAIELFFSIGAIGYRTTRAAGAFSTLEMPLSQETFGKLTLFLTNKGFRTELNPTPFDAWPNLVQRSGEMLKYRFREDMGIKAGRNGSSANPLGSATPRQASVLHFRPIRLEGQLRLLLIEAPHQRILGTDALRSHSYRSKILA